MNEYEMACEVRKRIEQFGRIIDGVYIFNMGGKFGTVKNYQQDEEHWEVMFDNLTHEQVIELFEGAGTCHVDVLNTGDCAGYECSEYIMHCNSCGHEFGHVLYNEDGDVWMSEQPKFCPYCGRRVMKA